MSCAHILHRITKGTSLKYRNEILLWNHPSVHYEYILLPLVNTEADWQDKVIGDNHPEDTGIEGDRMRELPGDTETEQYGNVVLRKSTKPGGKG